MTDSERISPAHAVRDGILQLVRVKGSRVRHLAPPTASTTICGYTVDTFPPNSRHTTCSACLTYWTVNRSNIRVDTMREYRHKMAFAEATIRRLFPDTTEVQS